MPDPVSEYAEYVIIARRGIAKLYLCQRGQWQDPGAVAVACARPLGAKQAVTRWLGRIRRVVMDRLPRMGDEAEVSSRYAVAPARQVPGADAGESEQSPRAPGRDSPALRTRRSSGDGPAQSIGGGARLRSSSRLSTARSPHLEARGRTGAGEEKVS